MLVEPAMEVCGGAGRRGRYRIVTAVEQPPIGRAALLDLVR
jgi:hypothetical protein